MSEISIEARGSDDQSSRERSWALVTITGSDGARVVQVPRGSVFADRPRPPSTGTRSEAAVQER